MGVKSFFKKFGQIALMEAPMILAAAGLPAALAPAIAIGIQAGKNMKGASNTQKAEEARKIAQQVITSTNAVLVQNGHPPLVDETVSDSALDSAIKLTYDVAKMKDAATGPDPVPPTP